VKRVFPQFVFILLLLFAQQAAFTHAAWHAHDQHPAQHDSKDKVSFQGSLCDLHVAFSAVLGGAHASPVHHAVQECGNERIVYRLNPLRVAESPIPLSRGPPVLL
jgi:hypothetical protein